MTPLISAHELSRVFGDLVAVDRVSFQVAEGEIYGLLGPNGAGKTTTLRMLAGLLTPSAGSVRVAGASPAEEPLVVKRALGYLTADTALYGRLTPREILRFFGRLNHRSRAWIDARTARLSEELGLGEFLDRRCDRHSTGQRQRAAIARALVHDPPVLVLDEPTASLDVLSARFILDRLVSEKERQKAVLFSTHHMAEAELICDRIGVIHRGRLLAEGTVPELCARAGATSLAGAFLGLIDAAEAA